MPQRIVTTADKFRHNFKETIMTVMEGQDVVLKYGHFGEILLTSLSPSKTSKKQKLLTKLKSTISSIKKLKKPSYKNNQEMYKDLMGKFI